MVGRLFTALIALVVAGTAFAHDSDVPFAEWMMSLRQPDHPAISCCGPADQFYAVEYHEDPVVPGGFIVKTNEFDELIRVPPEKVNWNDVNPTGRGVVFVSIHYVGDVKSPNFVYCFVPGIGS